MTPDADFLKFLNESLEQATLASFIGILVASAASVAVGRSLILLANQVRPWRLLLGIGINTIRFLMTCVVWIALPYFLGKFVWGSSLPLNLHIVVVALAFAPLSSAWLGLVPYFGRGILRFLYFLSFTLLFIYFILLGFENNVFILLPLGLIIMTILNLGILNPLQNFAAGRKVITNFKDFRV